MWDSELRAMSSELMKQCRDNSRYEKFSAQSRARGNDSGRHPMNPTRLLVLLTVVGTTGSILFAAEPAPAPKPETQQSAPAAAPASPTTPSEAPAAKQQDEDIDPVPPAKTDADKGPSPQRFVPSEQVRADFDVSFPIDI